MTEYSIYLLIFVITFKYFIQYKTMYSTNNTNTLFGAIRFVVNEIELLVNKRHGLYVLAQ